MNAPTLVYETYVRTSPGKLWQAITDPAFTRQYFYDTAVRSTWKDGDTIEHFQPDGEVALSGRLLEVTPPRRLVHTFSMLHDDEAKKDRPSRVTWEVVPRGETCLLRVTHDDFDGETRTFQIVRLGWNPILSGLKTLLETGVPLVIASGLPVETPTPEDDPR